MKTLTATALVLALGAAFVSGCGGVVDADEPCTDYSYPPDAKLSLYPCGDDPAAPVLPAHHPVVVGDSMTCVCVTK